MWPFGEWRPDLPAFENPGATVATNVVPIADHYESVSALVAVVTALDGPVLGFHVAKQSNGTVFVFCGTRTALYKLASGAWSDISKGGGYNTGSDKWWQFSTYGDYVVATNGADAPQYFQMGTSSLFADLGGTPPKAYFTNVVADFLVLGNLTDDSALSPTSAPDFVRWSGQDAITTWGTSASAQSDYQRLPLGGPVTAVVGGDYGVIFKERAIYRMTYTGPPTVFRFDCVENNRGTPSPLSVVDVGSAPGGSRLIFYWGHDGFYRFDGTGSQPIGYGKVDEWFLANCSEVSRKRIIGAYDPNRTLVYWLFTSSTSDTPDKILVYNWTIGKWSLIECAAEWVAPYSTLAYTLDELDHFLTPLPGHDVMDDASPTPVSGDVPLPPYISLDSDYYTQTRKSLCAFNASHQLCTFTGSTLEATIETAERQLVPFNRALVYWVRPLVDGGSTPTVRIGKRNRQEDAVTWGDSASMRLSGRCNVRSNARYHRARVTVAAAATWTKALGVDAYWTDAGDR